MFAFLLDSLFAKNINGKLYVLRHNAVLLETTIVFAKVRSQHKRKTLLKRIICLNAERV